MSDDDKKSTRVTLFDGKERSFPFWEEKYVARAYKKDFHQILDGTLVIPKFGTDYTTESPPDDPMKAIIEKNLGAYCDLVNAIDTQEQRGRTAFTLVTKTKSPIYPKGNAYEGFGNLQDKYRPRSEWKPNARIWRSWELFVKKRSFYISS
jgi:hypothetical protein